MYKVKMYNEHQIRAMLNSDKMQYENFYKDELITFLKFSVKENQQLKQQLEQKSKAIENMSKYIDSCMSSSKSFYGTEISEILNSTLGNIKNVLNEGSDK